VNVDTAFLGLIVRANQSVVGDRLMNAIQKQRVHVVLISAAASPRSAKQLRDKCDFYRIAWIDAIPPHVFDTVFAQPIAAVGVLDANMAKRVVQK
jgi:ribosomal protein L7Ae-like RNA K-turn-binding protein